MPFTISVAEGHALEVLLKWLKQAPPDLIIMGSHGRSRVARILLGSVAENVVREARCPTLIVRGPEPAIGSPHLERVLCAVNLTAASRDCVEKASSLAAAMRAELTVVQATEAAGDQDENARGQLCQWVPENVRAHCSVSEVVLKGNAAEQIILFARRTKTDLILLGAKHRSFLEFTTLGRTTERVLRHGPSSVLLLPGSESI